MNHQIHGRVPGQQSELERALAAQRAQEMDPSRSAIKHRKRRHRKLYRALELVATVVEPGLVLIVLRPLPGVELARLACVNKAFWIALKTLRLQDHGSRYARPPPGDIKTARSLSRFERAAMFGDIAVISTMMKGGVDESGTPLMQAQCINGVRLVDNSMNWAACNGNAPVLELLLKREFANVHDGHDLALGIASYEGHIDIIALLLRYGANIHAVNDHPLQFASENGHFDAVVLLIERGADARALDDKTLQKIYDKGNTAIIDVLRKHGARLPAP